MTPTYPTYATPFTREDIPPEVAAVQVDPDLAYPYWLGLLGYPTASPTQEQLECARRCMTEDLHRRVKFARYVEANFSDPAERAVVVKRPGMVAEAALLTVDAQMLVKITKDDRWNFSNFSPGSPIDSNVEYARLKREGKAEL